MLRFYTYIFACACVNAQARWKGSNGIFGGLIVATAIVYLNIGALLMLAPLIGLPLLRVSADRTIVVPIMVALAALCWLLFVRSGKGIRLAEELKGRGEESISICKAITGIALFGSIALFFLPAFLALIWFPPGHHTPSNAHGNVSVQTPNSRSRVAPE